MKKIILSIVALALILGSFPTAMVSGLSMTQEESSAENGIELPQETVNLEDDNFELPHELDLENDFTSTQDEINIDPQAVEYRFRRSWGGEGDQIKYPRNIVVKSDKTIIVANSGYSRITIINQNDNTIKSIGGSGNKPGEFDWPHGIALAPDGTLFVADMYNHRIQHLDLDGNVINYWGSEGSEAGQFSYPWGIAVSKSGFVYVIDMDNHRVQKFTLSGQFVKTWGSKGEELGQFNQPNGIAVDDQGSVYIVDRLNHRIQKFDSSGTFISQWGNGYLWFPDAITIDEYGVVYIAQGQGVHKYMSDGTYLGFLADLWNLSGQVWLDGLAVDKDGAIYVSVANHEVIMKYSSEGTLLRTWNNYIEAPGKFYYPTSIEITNTGDVLVSDSSNPRVQVFNQDGSLRSIIGKYGEGQGEFNYIADIAIDNNGNIYVADSGNSRIQIFNSNGGFIRTFGSEGEGDEQFDYLVSIAVDSYGNIYGLDRYIKKVKVFNNSGSFLKVLDVRLENWFGDYPSSIYIDKNDNIYVSHGILHQFNSEGELIRTFGNYGESDSDLSYANGINISTNGDIYIADSRRNRISVLDSYGNYLYSFGSFGYLPGQLSAPSDVLVAENGDVYVVDSGNHRIQVFSPQAIQPDSYSGLVQNGGFEKSPALMEWTTGGDLPVSRTSNRYQGNYGMRLGEPVAQTEQEQREAWAYTNFYVDPNWTRPVLRFKYKMSVNDIFDYSDFFVAIQDGVGLNHLETVLRDGYNPCNPGEPPSAGQDLGWRIAIFDLSKYKGQHIRVNFSNRNLWPDMSLGIWTDIDDVMVWDEGPLPYVGPYRTDLPLIFNRNCDIRAKGTAADENIIMRPLTPNGE